MSTGLLSEFEQELEVAAESLEAGVAGEAETTTEKRWHYIDAWLSTSGGWQFLEKAGPILETKAGVTTLRSTLQLKWQPTARAQGGTLLVRCFSHTGSQWVDCGSHTF